MIKKNLIANYFGQGWNALMGLAFIPIYIKYLGVEAYGLVGLFTVLQSWLGILDMGMKATLGREMARFNSSGQNVESIRDLLRSIELITVGVAFLIFCGITLGSKWIAINWLKVDTLPTALVAQAFSIMGLVASLSFVEGVYRSAIIGMQRQVLFNIINSIMATLRGLGAVGILAWVSPTVEAFFLWQGMISIITLIILATITYSTLPKGNRKSKFSIHEVKGVWRFAYGIFLFSLLNMMNQVDKIILSKLLVLNEYGTYLLAVNIAFIIFNFISPIQQTFYPQYCALQARGDIDTLTKIYHKSTQLVTVFAGSAAIVLALYSETILNLWVGRGELTRNAAHLTSCLVIGYLILGLLVLPIDLMRAFAWNSLSLKLYALGVPFVVGLNLYLIPNYGADGASFVLCLYATTLLITMIHFLHRRILKTEKWYWYIQDVLFPLFAAFIGVWVIKYFWSAQETKVEQTISLVVAMTVSLIASTLAANHLRPSALLFISRIGNYKSKLFLNK